MRHLRRTNSCARVMRMGPSPLMTSKWTWSMAGTSTNLGSSWGAGMAMGLTAGISGTGEEGSEATIYASLAADLRTRLDELKKERDILESEQGATSAMRRNYEFFLRCLTELPEKNDVGMKMNVNGLDVEGSMFRDMDGKAKPGIRSGVKSGHIRVTEEKTRGSAGLPAV